ncbi:hypothetical protein BDU57DRAFT_328611 [Ampelomyces quisqualis]|uniref:Uncharacterized protein n=1 Tax=Ampelomyces quisqualis TaxID=50730 RepID=A0A6A5QGN4_AMPQU|nr:hypothetical protein BDU57DRAFT_328611 [Ampelomyces quisqualis]
MQNQSPMGKASRILCKSSLVDWPMGYKVPTAWQVTGWLIGKQEVKWSESGSCHGGEMQLASTSGKHPREHGRLAACGCDSGQHTHVPRADTGRVPTVVALADWLMLSHQTVVGTYTVLTMRCLDGCCCTNGRHRMRSSGRVSSGTRQRVTRCNVSPDGARGLVGRAQGLWLRLDHK